MILLEKRNVDIGYPDPGHDEYFLIKSVPRGNKIIQYILGNKKEDVFCYGDSNPSDVILEEHIERFGKIELSKSRECKLNKLIK